MKCPVLSCLTVCQREAKEKGLGLMVGFGRSDNFGLAESSQFNLQLHTYVPIQAWAQGSFPTHPLLATPQTWLRRPCGWLPYRLPSLPCSFEPGCQPSIWTGWFTPTAGCDPSFYPPFVKVLTYMVSLTSRKWGSVH